MKSHEEPWRAMKSSVELWRALHSLEDPEEWQPQRAREPLSTLECPRELYCFCKFCITSGKKVYVSKSLLMKYIVFQVLQKKGRLFQKFVRWKRNVLGLWNRMFMLIRFYARDFLNLSLTSLSLRMKDRKKKANWKFWNFCKLEPHIFFEELLSCRISSVSNCIFLYFFMLWDLDEQ